VPRLYLPRKISGKTENSHTRCVKTCTSCDRRLRDSAFYRDDSGAPYAPCKECRRTAGRARHNERRQDARLNYERLATP
jgi:hypothetical protein